MKEWYVLAIRSQQHARLSVKLEKLDVELWYPMRTVWRKHRNKPRTPKQYPLIPSYMFVRFDPQVLSVRKILSIDGAINFLSSEGFPQRVPEEAMRFIRDSEQRGNYDETLKRIEELIVGHEIIIDDGPFSGFPGKVTQIKGSTITADVWLFGRRQPIKINVDKVTKPL